MTSARLAAVACTVLSLAFVPARADDRQKLTDQDRQRLTRFEKQVDEIRTLIKVTFLDVVVEGRPALRATKIE